MRTKISNRENCTYRDVKKYLQIQIQEKYSKEKLSKQWSLSFDTQLAMKEQFHLKNGQLQRTLTTDDFSHSVTPGIICKVLDLGCYVIYLNTDRNTTWLGLS